MANNALPKLILNQGDNPNEAWKQWINSFQIYLIATEVNKKDEKVQIAQLLHFGGADLQKIYSTFKISSADKDKIAPVIEKFNNYFSPRQNLTFLRYKFFTSKQAENKSLEEFITDLKKQAQSCEFGELCDELIKLMLICGTNNSEIRHKLLQEEDADLEKAVQLSAIIEQSKVQAHKMSRPTQESETGSVDRVVVKRTFAEPRVPFRPRGRSTSRDYRDTRNRSKTRGYSTGTSKQITNCTRCGYSHQINECPAFNKKCECCKKFNHFANVCKNRSVNSLTYNESAEVENKEIYIGTINKFHDSNSCLEVNTTDIWLTNIKINNKIVSFKLDTGAMANIISIQHFEKLNLPFYIIKPAKITLKSYTGDVVHTYTG